MAQNESEIRYLTPPTVEIKKKKYCRFKKAKIKFIDYKDPEFLKKFLNEQGKKNYRNFCKVPKESSNRCEESKTSCFVALLNRLDEIILRKEDTNGDNIIDRHSQLRT